MTIEPSSAERFAAAAGRVLLVLIAATVLILIGLWLKRRYLDDDERPDRVLSSGFGLSELRAMRERGELTDDEFERARTRIVKRAQDEVAADVSAAGDPDRPPAEAARTTDVDLVREAEQ